MPRPVRAVPAVDTAAERAVVASAMAFPDRIEAVAADLTPDHFADVQLGMAWEAIVAIVVEGGAPDPVVVADRAHGLGGTIDADDLQAMVADAGPPRREHVEIVLSGHAAREARRTLADARSALDVGDDPFDVATKAAAQLDAIGSCAGSGTPEAMTLPELIERASVASPWVIPGMLRRDWRAVIIASEGLGKSTLLRQIAVCAAQGIHPFTLVAIDPVRSLVVDAENPLAAISETGAPLDASAREIAGTAYDPDRCRIWSRPGGLDLREPADRAALVRELRAQRPDLVCAGPIYKLGRRRPGESYEDAAEGLLAVVDELRVRFGFALVAEHHAPKAQGGRREMAPFGSQRWLAWPEIGIGLVPEKDAAAGTLRLDRFRGDRLRNWWPDRIARDETWPFVGEWDAGVPGPSDWDDPKPALTIHRSSELKVDF